MKKARIKIFCNCCGKMQRIHFILQHTGKHAIVCIRGHVVGEYTEYTLRKINTVTSWTINRQGGL